MKKLIRKNLEPAKGALSYVSSELKDVLLPDGRRYSSILVNEGPNEMVEKNGKNYYKNGKYYYKVTDNSGNVEYVTNDTVNNIALKYDSLAANPTPMFSSLDNFMNTPSHRYPGSDAWRKFMWKHSDPNWRVPSVLIK